MLARVSAAIQEKGEEKAARELEIARVFARRVRHSVRGNLRKIDVNDDELAKSIADDAFEREAFGWDAR